MTFQASWDEERRELLRRELLSQQICEAMIPHLRPGCPLRDVAAVRAAASWSSELGRWRLPDVSSRIPLPPAGLPAPAEPTKSDLNNNSGAEFDGDGSPDEESAAEDYFAEPNVPKANIADVYFKRNRIDKILAHVREAKTFGESRVAQHLVKSWYHQHEHRSPAFAQRSPTHTHTHTRTHARSLSLSLSPSPSRSLAYISTHPRLPKKAKLALQKSKKAKLPTLRFTFARLGNQNRDICNDLDLLKYVGTA
jgi:hypothetical protein